MRRNHHTALTSFSSLCYFTHRARFARHPVQEKTKNALDSMGIPVLKGGLTTFVGTVVLSMASSTAFRIFFKVCFGTVVFGVLHGIFLMPVLLGFYVEMFGVLKTASAKVETSEEL